MAIEILLLLPGLFLLILANYTEKKKEFRIITQVLLGMLILTVIANGLLIIAMSGTSAMEGLMDAGATHGYGVAVFLTGLFASMLFLKPVRYGLAAILDISGDNWLHITAMVFAILLTGVSLATAANLDISALGQGSGSVMATVLLQDCLFVISAFFGVGWMVRRKWKDVLKRLGIVKPSPRDIGMSLGFLGILFAIIITVGLISMILQYESGVLETKDDPTLKIIGGVTILSALLFAFGAGISEEILFRGAMQPRLGIIITSLVFTAAHTQYPNPVQMATLFTMSVVFGYERVKLNTTACIITHVLYDLLMLLTIALL